MRLALLLLLALGTLTGATRRAAAQPPKPDLPRVLLLGDPVRLGSVPLVGKRLDGQAEVMSPKDASNPADVPRHLDRWLAGTRPAVVHFTCEPRDLKAVAGRLKEVTPDVVFTPPRAEDVAEAAAILRPLGIPVHDRTRVAPGAEPLADAVADVIRRQLAVRNPTRLKPPAAGPDAVAAYRKAEADGDAQVPAAFRKLPFPTFDPPTSAADWATRRPDVKAKVVASLGDLPPRPAKPIARLVSAEVREGFRLERLRLDNGVDGEMSALMLIPDGLKGPAPTILWLHSSSYNHTQLLTPNSNGGEEPLGLTFVKRGWVVFAPDAAWYGDRSGQGPAGPAETTRAQQESQHKYHLWFGRTLWGMFVRDDQVALDYLCTRPEVDTKKIGATGISMGSTRSWWLAAVDDRIAAVVGVACLTRYENLIRHGQLRVHGVYYFVNGLLKHFDTEAVVSLIAPRPVLFLTGELDAGSPADGIKLIEAKAGAVYDAAGAGGKFRSVRYPDVGHTYTPAMRAEMLAWFDKWLK